ncbi:hypothetical protein GGI06_003111 [Coemansia sp. S85]|nr:hypothetical protein GGI06_003111 [Coemansia sp. S85]
MSSSQQQVQERSGANVPNWDTWKATGYSNRYYNKMMEHAEREHERLYGDGDEESGEPEQGQESEKVVEEQEEAEPADDYEPDEEQEEAEPVDDYEPDEEPDAYDDDYPVDDFEDDYYSDY